MKLTYEDFLKIKSKKVRTNEENKLIADFFLSQDINIGDLFSLDISWPKSFSINVGYEPDGATDYIVLENKNKVEVFDSCSIHGPVEFVLFLIENGEYIAVDGACYKDSWKI